MDIIKIIEDSYPKSSSEVLLAKRIEKNLPKAKKVLKALLNAPSSPVILLLDNYVIPIEHPLHAEVYIRMLIEEFEQTGKVRFKIKKQTKAI